MADIFSEIREFFLQLVDNVSFVAVEEYSIGSWSTKNLCKLLDCDPGILNLRGFYILEEDSRRKIESIFGIDLSKGDYQASLLSWSKSDGLPYRTHAGREFILMRDGLKPLSVFTSMVPEVDDSLSLPTHLFSPLLEDGTLVCRTYCELLTGNAMFNGIEVLLYASSNQAWRLDAYILLRSTARRMGWSEPLIRMEGTLLGYAEWQNDAFIAAREDSERNAR